MGTKIFGSNNSNCFKIKLAIFCGVDKFGTIRGFLD